MQYYKVIKDDRAIDVLNENEICYLKYSKRHQDMINAISINDAQAILSSDQKHVWHESTLLSIPIEGYDTVKLEKIDVYEYNRLKFELSHDINSLLDNYTMLLIERGVL